MSPEEVVQPIKIYFPDQDIRPLISKNIRKLARKNGYEIVESEILPAANVFVPAIIVTSVAGHPVTYANNSYVYVLNAQGSAKNFAFDVLRQIIKNHADRLIANETTGLRQAGNNVGKNPFKAIAVDCYLKTLLGQDLEFSWSNLFYNCYNLILNPSLSTGGTFPFVIFNGQYAKKVLGNHEGLIIWAIASSAIANFSISLRSLSQLPSLLITQLPLVVKKVIAELSKKGITCNTSKILGLTLILLVANYFSVYAGFTLASQSTKDFSKDASYSNDAVLATLTITEIVGVVAVVLRATMNKWVDIALDDVKEISSTLRKILFTEMNHLIINDPTKLDEDKISKLANGQLENRTTRIYGLAYIIERVKGTNPYAKELTNFNWRDVICTTVQWGSYALLAAVAIYSTAYGILAADAVTEDFTLEDLYRFTDLYASLIAVANFTTKLMLLGTATMYISDFIKNLVRDDIITTNADISHLMKAVIFAVIFGGTGWNTWFSASDITETYLWDNFIFDAVIGIGATWAMNYLDTCAVFSVVIEKAREYYHSVRGITSHSSFDQMILARIKQLAAMPAREFAATYTNRYALQISAIQVNQLQENVTNLAENFNVIPNHRFYELQESISQLRTIMGNAHQFQNLRRALPTASKYSKMFNRQEQDNATKLQTHDAEAGRWNSGSSGEISEEEERMLLRN